MCNIRIRTTVLPDELSGFFDQWRGYRTIVLNATHAETRQRFTIAHELYHFLARHDYGMSAEWDSHSPQERAANRFAACFLMPEDQVRLMLSESAGPEQIALAFRTSLEAASLRIRELTDPLSH